MSSNLPSFNSNVVRPVECFKQAYQLIKDQYWLFVGLAAATIIGGSLVPFGIIMGPLMCGLYMCFLKRMDNEKVSFELLMKGFDFFKPSLIASLILTIPLLIIALPLNSIFIGSMVNQLTEILRQNNGHLPADKIVPMILGLSSGIGLYAGILGILSLTVGILFSFTYPLIVDKNLGAVDALKVSAQAAIANIFGMIGLMALNMLVGLLGVSCCYVGAFLVMPINLAAFAVAYRHIFSKKLEYPM